MIFLKRNKDMESNYQAALLVKQWKFSLKFYCFFLIKTHKKSET